MNSTHSAGVDSGLLLSEYGDRRDFLYLYSVLLECQGGGWTEFKGSPSSGVLDAGGEERGRDDLFDVFVEKRRRGLKGMLAATHRAE